MIIMNSLYSIILLIGKTKRKSRDIERILARADNFEKVIEHDKDTWYKIYSLRHPNRFYKVFKSKRTGGYFCDCDFNTLWREYKPGKERKNARYCVHILALQVFFASKDIT